MNTPGISDRARWWRAGGVLILCCVPIAAGVLSRPPGKDGIRHFIYLHSIVYDGDLDFDNEFRALYPRYNPNGSGWVSEVTGLAVNPSPIGPAIVWLPSYLLVALLGLDPGGLGAGSRIATDVSSAAMFSLAVWLAYLLAASRTRRPGLAVALVAGSSFFVYWWLYPLVMGHGIAVGTATLFVWFWHRSLADHSVRTGLLLGLLAGLITIVRWANLILPALGLVYWLYRSRSPREGIVAGGAAGVGGLVAIAPQLIAWKVIYGAWIVSPQGNFMHWDKPYLLETLFSPRYGLLGFSPILYLPLLGLLIVAVRWRQLLDPLTAFALVYIPITIYVNASAGDWYGGATFGQRRMDSLFPFLVVGAAYALEVLEDVVRKRPAVPIVSLAALGAAFTAALTGGYQTGGFNVGMVGADRFPQDAIVDVLDTVGWPPSWPAEAFHKLQSGTRWGQYTALAGDDRITWLDGVLVPEPRHLDEGWELQADGSQRVIAEHGVIYFYLMDLGFMYRDLRLHLVMRGEPAAVLAWREESPPVTVNRWTVRGSGRKTPTGLTYRIDVPYSALRPGLNRIEVPRSDLSLLRLRLCGAEVFRRRLPCQ